MVGKGYPNSCYKVYARPPRKAKWWRFEVGAAPSTIDPIKDQAKLPVEGRVTVVWAPVHHMINFTHHPERTSIARLLARAAELQSAG